MENILCDFIEYKSGYKLFGSKTLFIFIYPYKKRLFDQRAVLKSSILQYNATKTVLYFNYSSLLIPLQ